MSKKHSPFLKIKAYEQKDYWTVNIDLFINLSNILFLKKEEIIPKNHNSNIKYRCYIRLNKHKEDMLIDEKTYDLLKNYINENVGILDIEQEAKNE